MNLTRATTYYLPNEPCWAIGDTDKPLPIPGAPLHRIRLIKIVRGDTMVDYEEDLGPSTNFKKEGVIIPGFYEHGNGRYEVLHTVRDLIVHMEDWYADDAETNQRRSPPPDFKGEFQNFAERRRKVRSWS